MAAKSAPKSGRFPKGHDPRRGRGPAKGAPNAGRPPDSFKAAMQALATREDVLRRLNVILTDANTAADVFLRAWKEVADRGYGRANQTVEHTGSDGGPIQHEVALADLA